MMQTTTPEGLVCYLTGRVADMMGTRGPKMPRSVVLMLVGPPGSGKTTAREFIVALLEAAGVPFAVVSQDDNGGNAAETKKALNVALLGPDSSTLEKAQKDLAKMLRAVDAVKTAAARAAIESKIDTKRNDIELLQQKVDGRKPNVVIVDRCNADKKQRWWVCAAALQAHAWRVALMLPTPLELAAERAALRQGHPTLPNAALAFNVSVKCAEACLKEPPRVGKDFDAAFALGRRESRLDPRACIGSCVFDACSSAACDRAHEAAQAPATRAPGRSEGQPSHQPSRSAVQLTYAGWFPQTSPAVQHVQELGTPPEQLRVALPHVTVAFGADATRAHLDQVGRCAQFAVESVVETKEVTFAVLVDDQGALHHMTLATAPGATPAGSIAEFEAYAKNSRTATTTGEDRVVVDLCFCAMVSLLTPGIREETQAKPCVLVTSSHGLQQLGLLDSGPADLGSSDSGPVDLGSSDSGMDGGGGGGGGSDDKDFVVPASFACGSKGPLLYPAPPLDFGRVMSAFQAMTQQPQTTLSFKDVPRNSRFWLLAAALAYGHVYFADSPEEELSDVTVTCKA